MKRLLTYLCCCLLCFQATLHAEEVTITLQKSNQKDFSEERSSIFLPTVTYDGYSLFFYADYPIEDMQIFVEDEMGNEILNIITTLPPQQAYELAMPSKGTEEYTLRIIIDKTEYYGYF